MAVISEGIRESSEHTIDFGNYAVAEKLKVDNFQSGGDVYKVKTHAEVTRLEKNGRMIFESVPGSAVFDFIVSEKLIQFGAEGMGNTQMTLELESQTDYKIYIDDVYADKIKTNISGKINFSMDLTNHVQNIKIEKVI